MPSKYNITNETVTKEYRVQLTGLLEQINHQIENLELRTIAYNDRRSQINVKPEKLEQLKQDGFSAIERLDSSFAEMGKIFQKMEVNSLIDRSSLGKLRENYLGTGVEGHIKAAKAEFHKAVGHVEPPKGPLSAREAAKLAFTATAITRT